MKKAIFMMLFMAVATFAFGQTKLELSQTTANGDWTFTNGCSISNESGKSYSTGTNGTIKYSAGVTYTINLPSGINIVRAVIEGYDNYDTTDSYISLFGGKTYDANTYVFPQKTSSGTVTKKYTIDLTTPISGTLTFKADGKQVCWKITLYDYIEETYNKYALSQETYSGSEWSFQNGFSITNNNGKLYSTGTGSTIKYSAGVQYTIHIPDGISIKSVSITGYDNYADNDSYVAELNGKVYDASTYVFPKKSNDAAVTKTHTITLDTPATGTLTFTPKGQQVCWSIILYDYEYTPGISYPISVSQMEHLDRGLVILPAKSGTGQFISWRFLGTENFKSTTFDLKRNGIVIASDITGATCYTDAQGTTSSQYQVVTKVNGTVTSTTNAVTSWGKEYLALTLNRPGSSYTPNDISVGDIDGDGQYELFVKWDPSTSKDNSQSGKTDNVYIDCYRLDGTFVWRIDLGTNIRAGAHYTQFMVYDFDGDGKAEMICKTAPGSKDGKGNYVSAAADDSNITSTNNTTAYRNSSGYILSGPEYLTVFEGMTGKAIHTIWYNPNRGGTFNTTASYPSSSGFWGDNYGNRSERYLACVAYLDGPSNNPSAVMCRGYYTRAYVWAVDFNGSKLTHKWLHASVNSSSVEHYDANWTKTTKTYSTNTCGKGSLYTLYGNGNHNLSVGDVDGDGCDEIIWGSGAVDNDGKLLYSVGYGHGDAIHLADFNPDRPGLELFDVHEENINPYGGDLHDAATGEVLYSFTASADTGRGMAADVDTDNKGGEFWSSGGSEVRSVDGTTISTSRPSQCMRIYWDGDLQDELFDGHYDSSTGKCSPAVEKWNTSKKKANTYKSFTDIGNSQTCNTTKATPNLIADIFGDWREEIIMWDYSDGCTINIFSTNEATDYRLPTLMHDHVYRMGIAWQNVAYNQPAHVGYYLPDYVEYLANTEAANNDNPTGETQNVILKYTSTGKQDTYWTDGLYTLSGVTDGWENSSFKMGEGTYILSLPSDVRVKQITFKDFNANYNGGELTSLTSEGATVTIPAKHDYQEPDDTAYDLTITLENHVAGTPISFTLQGGGQPVAWFELVIEKVALTTAPQLKNYTVTSTTDKNHCVVALNFDREMESATATIAGQTVTAEGGSATLYFPIWDLSYNSQNTFSIAKGAAMDTYGNTNSSAITVSVNVGTKATVTKAVYDYVVTNVTEWKAALSAVNTSNNNATAERKVIFVRNGDYDFGTEEQRFTAYNVSIIGESRDGVILHGTRDGISNPILNLRDRTGFYLQDLTVRNDLNYGKSDKGGVAVAIYGGNKTVMKNVCMLSNQDTQVTGHRAYFEQCKIHGTVDFICGGGDNFYWKTDLVLEDRSGNCITAPSTTTSTQWGYVFQECNINAMSGASLVTDGSYNLGRPWQNEPRCYFLNTKMNVKPSNGGWASMSTLPTHFYEYNSVDKNGNAIDLSVRSNSPTSTNSYTPVLSSSQATKFTLRNVLGGTDSWLPTEETEASSSPTPSVNGMTISWSDVPNARCCVIYRDGNYVTNQTANTYLATQTGTYTIQTANANGGLGGSATVTVTGESTIVEDETEKQPAFPGAEGFGRYVSGGRGGAVYHVTNLNDSGSGSLRWALGQSGRKIIVFDVSGTIHLNSALNIGSNVTIAGQTAPGDGICIADYPCTIKGSNVIVRYMRFRLGNKNVTLDGADGWDGFGGMDQEDIIIDHCSVSWSIDECLSMLGNKNTTVQWCLVAQSLVNSGHSKGAHGYGGNWGGSGASFHHNLLTHHTSRTPRLGPRPTTQLDERMDMRNNVIYNFGGNGCYGGEGMNVNIVNNYYKPGPGSPTSYKGRRIAGLGIRTNEYVATNPDYAPALHIWGKYYVDGNVNSLYPEVATDNWTNGIYNQISASECDGTYTQTTKDTIRLNNPIRYITTTTHSAEDAYERVLDYAGASFVRDTFDALMVSDTRNGTATYTGDGLGSGFINTQDDNKPAGASSSWSAWPTLSSTTAPTDTDGDGMPDSWEEANGLNKNDATDGSSTADNGFTNIENYINSIVATITDAQNAGGTAMGEKEKKDESLGTGYDISAETSNGDWTFAAGFSIVGESGTPAVVAKTNYLKFSRNHQYTISIPEGISITSVTITGNLNLDSGTAYLKELNGQTFSSTTYVFPARTANDDRTYTITLDTPATNTLTFTASGDGQVGWQLRLNTKDEETPQTDMETVAGTITLPFYDGNTDFAINYSDAIRGKVAASVTLGSALGCSARRIVNGAQFNEISTTEANATSGNDANALTITITTSADNTTFKPTAIMFNSCKIGTDGGKFDLALDATSLYTGEQPNRNNETSGYYSSYSKTLSSNDAVEHEFVFHIYGLNNKNLGLGNIVITGELTSPVSTLIGDVNGDGLVNVTDVVCLVNYILTSDASNIILEAADVNGDGSINITDTVTLTNLILTLE